MQFTRRVTATGTSLLNYGAVTRKSTYSPTRNAEYCLESVQKHDYESFLWLLLLPDEARSPAVSVRAFNIELATIKDVTSTVELGKMRINFWKEAIEDIYQGVPPSHPVAEELYEAVQSHRLSKRWLQRIVRQREQTLEDRPFTSLEEVENFAEDTASSMLYLTLEILGTLNLNADHAASHIGKAQGLTTLIRAIPYHATRRNVLLPRDLLIKHNVTEESIIRGQAGQPIKDVIYEIASNAHSHVIKAHSMKDTLPRAAYPVMLSVTPVERYLERIQKADFNVYDPALQRRDALLPWSLWWKKLRKTF